MDFSSAGSPLDSKYWNSVWASPMIGTYRHRQSMLVRLGAQAPMGASAGRSQEWEMLEFPGKWHKIYLASAVTSCLSPALLLN